MIGFLSSPLPPVYASFHFLSLFRFFLFAPSSPAADVDGGRKGIIDDDDNHDDDHGSRVSGTVKQGLCGKTHALRF